MLSKENLRIKPGKTALKIVDYLRENVEKSGLENAIVSISGGIDSAVSLVLTVRALGPGRVTALTLPERDITPPCDITDVMQLTGAYDVTCDTVEITPVITCLSKILPKYNPEDRVSTGNLKARTRMIIAYHYANVNHAMVVGSTNRTEWMTGYFTKYGDGGVDLMPLADLYKNQIRQLAEYLDIPRTIITKTPTAGFWSGQSDEEELGVKYDILDLILLGFERGMPDEDISRALDKNLDLVRLIRARVEANGHKRHIPTILRLRNVSS
jgi:NAD+ synthase